jgi:predicted DNA-binding transcriptional regulator YafY
VFEEEQHLRRVDRLIAILIALQQRAETAQSLAEKFEISKRTILRDMQALSEMGIPLYSMTGPKGGFRLMEGFQLPPLQMDSQEALALLFALKAMTQMSDTPFNQARYTVMDKIRKILPEELLKKIDPILEKFEMDVPKRNFKIPHLAELLTYISESKWLDVFYRSANHQRWLLIYPGRVYASNGFWYCEAYSLTHQENRLFRVDRMETIKEAEAPVIENNAHNASTPTPTPVPTKEPSSNSKFSTRIQAKLTYKGMLTVEQDAHIGELVRWVSDDEWEIDFQCPSSEWDWAVRFFFALGMNAQVLEPAALRYEISQLAKQLHEHYLEYTC